MLWQAVGLLAAILDTLLLFRLAVVLGLCGALLSAALKAVENYWDTKFLNENVLFDPAAYTSFTFLLAFMIAFRTNQAYGRYWEGCTLLQVMMGNWYDAASSLVAFCHYSDAGNEAIDEFQQVLVRLFSLINAMIFCELAGEAHADHEASKYALLDVTGLEREVLKAVTRSRCRPELVFQRIQALVVTATKDGVLSVPPPILTRAFQEMSNAMVNFHEATKLPFIPFPSSYLAAFRLLVFVHFVVTPIVVISWTPTSAWAAVFSFIQIFIMASLMHLAKGLDNPFDSDGFGTRVDLKRAQHDFNLRLACLLADARTPAPRLAPEAMRDAKDLLALSINSMSLAPVGDGQVAGEDLGQTKPVYARRHSLMDVYNQYNESQRPSWASSFRRTGRTSSSSQVVGGMQQSHNASSGLVSRSMHQDPGDSVATGACSARRDRSHSAPEASLDEDESPRCKSRLDRQGSFQSMLSRASTASKKYGPTLHPREGATLHPREAYPAAPSPPSTAAPPLRQLRFASDESKCRQALPPEGPHPNQLVEVPSPMASLAVSHPMAQSRDLGATRHQHSGFSDGGTVSIPLPEMGGPVPLKLT